MTTLRCNQCGSAVRIEGHSGDCPIGARQHRVELIESFQRDRDEWFSAPIREILSEYEEWRAASADTRPEGGDTTEIAAPFTSGAVPNEDSGDAQP